MPSRTKAAAPHPALAAVQESLDRREYAAKPACSPASLAHPLRNREDQAPADAAGTGPRRGRNTNRPRRGDAHQPARQVDPGSARGCGGVISGG